MRNLIVVALGGGLGSVLRYLAQVWVGKYTPVAFPLGTFLVNISGCLLIGLFYGLAGRQGWFTQEWRLLLITGVCGGYTTFSSFSFESMELLRQGSYGYFAFYVAGSVLLGLLATVGGYALLIK